MSVKFDSKAAEKLIREMNRYCLSVRRETVELHRLLKLNKNWSDQQYQKFANNIMEINEELIKALEMQYSYVQIFSDRVKELRG